MDAVIGYCLNETSKNPIEILDYMMSLPFCHMHGPEHHTLVGSALLTAYRNAGGEIELLKALKEMMARGQKVPGGACGFWGSCGAAISTGMCMSILSGGKNVLRETLQDPAFPNDPNYFIPSTYYLESGSYLRLATLSVAYTFNHLGGWLRSLQVYATAKNVFTITGYKGLDPEVELSGTEPGLDRRETFYPHTRSFMLGVKVNF